MSNTTSTPPIADRPEDLTAEWLTDALRSVGRLVEGRAVSVDARPLGTGQMCDSMRVAVTWEGEVDLPPSFVVKFPSADPSSRTTALIMRSYEKETRFYQKLAGELPVNTPELFYGDIDTTTGSFVLVLEDRAPAVQGDQIVGCSPEVAAEAALELANLHAPRWGIDDPGDDDWLARPTADQRSLLASSLPLLWAEFKNRYDGTIEPVLRKTGDVFFEHIGNFLEADLAATAITHADFRLDNLLFLPGAFEGTATARPTVVDWQTVAIGCPAHDVGYFLGTGLRTGDRRASEFEILANYRTALAAAGVEYTERDLEWEYRRGAWAGFVLLVGAAVLVERTERGDEMFLTMLHRCANHVADLDADETIR